MISIREPAVVEVLKFPHPYQAAFTVASDIDSASAARFRAFHALFCQGGLIKEGRDEWKTLGLTRNCAGYDSDRRGVPGLGLGFADSFFLIADPTTFGMFRHSCELDSFSEDQEDGENCAELIRRYVKDSSIDSFHGFLHYTRKQVLPLLSKFYNWCEQEGAAKPSVWINHSAAVTPSGLCPDKLQPSRLNRLARLAARNTVGPLVGRARHPVRYAFVRYDGDTPGSPYYVNDVLSVNGLRYAWLNTGDLCRDQIALPENIINDQPTLLQPVTMDDGVRYWRFKRCYSRPPKGAVDAAYLRDSESGCDASRIITESNLEELCRLQGTCILYSHATHSRSFPISDKTIERFTLLKRWRDNGKIWVTNTANLLEWTRRRTFLKMISRFEGKKLIVEIGGVNDPIFGWEKVDLKHLHGLSVRVRDFMGDVVIAVQGRALEPDQVRWQDNLFHLDTKEEHRGAAMVHI